MKTKIPVLFLLVTMILVSCTSVVTTTYPTETAVPTIPNTPVPTPTISPIPATATSTVISTPAPENIADARDLPNWINDYVGAFGGKVILSGVEINAGQLTAEIRKNSDTYTLAKSINGKAYLFLVINGTPLAIREGTGQWQEAASRKIADLIGITVGGPIADPYFESSQPRDHVDSAIGREFNGAYLLTNSWALTESEQNIFNFTRINNAIGIADAYDMKKEGDHIVYSHSNFLYTYLKEMKQASSNEILPIILNHARRVMTELKGKIDVIAPMNEVRPPSELNDDDTEPYDWLTKIMGGKFDYMTDIYRVVREADPDVALIYNDTRNETTNNGYLSRGTKYTKLIAEMLERDNLINGVGVQFHIDDGNKPPEPKDVTQTLQSYQLPIYITEFDVGGDLSIKEQARLYKQYIVLILNSGVCKHINFWDANAHFFDDQMKPNLILYAVREALFEYLP